MADLPTITCLCPTYGRFSRLREALACFLAQDYPNKRLLILNDGPLPIHVSERDGGVDVINPRQEYANLGEKRQALLEAAQTPLVAHWDDDDLYLPWHLSRSVEALLREGVGCVKSRGAWFMQGTLPGLTVRGPCHNVFEGTMVFHRHAALDLGGYPFVHSGQAKALMRKFHEAGALYKIGDGEDGPSASSSGPRGGVSYVYRWANGVGHISGIGNRDGAAEKFRAQNHDFGHGQPLAPADLTPYWEAIPCA